MVGGVKSSSQKWPILLFTIGVFMAGIDNGIISVALTTINDSFGVSPSWGAWSITLYTLGIAISVPVIGKLSDRFGRRRLFIVEIALFGFGSLLVALSPNFVFLLIARFIQAIGGGGIFIIGSAHILATLPRNKQGKALGLLGGMHGLSAVIGPNLGAVILSISGSWQWMFLINVPIALLLIIFGFLKIEETKPGTEAPLDLVGTFLLSSGVLSLMYGFTQLDSSNFVNSLVSIHVAPFIIFGIGLLITLINYEKRVESRGGDPIIAYSLLTKRLFQVTIFIGLLSGGFLAGIIFIPSYVQQVLHIPVEQAGFWLTPLALSSGIGAGLGGFLTDKHGPVRAIIISGFIGIIGFFLFPVWVHNLVSFVIASVIAGVGLGILLGAPLNVLVGESAKQGEQGSALGTLSLFRQIGLTLFPMIYAGFVTGGFTQIERTISTQFSDVFIAVEAFSQDSYSSLMTNINQLTNLELQNTLREMISTLLANSYNKLFITSGILSLLVIWSGLYLASYRGKQKD